MLKSLNHFVGITLSTFFFLLIATCLKAQVTSATLSGLIRNNAGEPLASASVTVEFPDAGITESFVTKTDGRFIIPNLRVGGPYRVTVDYVGYDQSVTEDIYLELGQYNNLEIVMDVKTTEIEGVTVFGRSRVFDNKRTGASTNINNRMIRNLPTISRSEDDFLRLVPSASPTYNGMSFAGRNGQYNNYSLDGAVFNNPFGLDAPTPGGQTNAQPISLDAIEQIQVNLAPYDVTQAGFTGAGVNTVTKSGSNKFRGTVYGFYRNDALSGKKVDGNKLVVPDLSQLQAGFALGGAITQNKLYYFVSFETEQRKDGASAYQALNSANAGKSNTSRVLESDLMDVSKILKNRFNYETGPYQGYNLNQVNYKWLAKIDWNINSVHKLSFTYNGLDASKEKPAHPSALGRRGPDYITLQFRNSGYEITNKLHSFIAELKSNFNGNYANMFRAVYTIFRDKRNPFSDPFPVVNISKNGVRYIVAGHEPFSINNRLNQDALQITDNFNAYFNKHTLTAGASYESFKFGNSFNLTGYGPTVFWDTDIQNFKDSVPVGGATIFGAYPLDVDVAYAKNRAKEDKWTWYYMTVAQLSAYLQDEWAITKDFHLTYGLRVDMPIYSKKKFRFENPLFNADGTFTDIYDIYSPTRPNNDDLIAFDENGNYVTTGKGNQLDNTKLPKQTPLFSPRVGFNWDVNGEKTLQVRGGSGIFTGRFPFVWLGNHIGNPYSSYYNVTKSDFQWPQVWRTNIGADIRIPFGTIISADVAYTKDLNAMMVRNYRLATPEDSLNSGTGDKRDVYLPGDIGTVNTYVFTNTNVGHQFNISLQAQQSFQNDFYAMIGYNFLISKDASSISAEISGDAFDRNPILGNANKAVESNSLYGNKHRIIMAAVKRFSYGEDDRWATTISLFGSFTSGNHFAYVYAGDINADGTATNDLLYVPTDAEINAMNFAPVTDINGNVQDAATQRTALKKFIAQDSYLSGLRGKYTEKYGAETPWFNQFDLRILQDLNFSHGERTSSLQLSLDFVNFGNLISSKWGVQKYATTSGYFQPIGVSLNNNNPIYTFDPSLTETFVSSPDLASRWQLQIGLRYNF